MNNILIENDIKKHIVTKNEDVFYLENLITEEISLFLKNEIEDLNVSSHLFKSGLERNLNRILVVLERNEKTMLIFPDSIPGFTTMCVKKTKKEIKTKEIKKHKKNYTQEIEEINVIEMTIERFFNKNKQKTIVFETNEIVIILFPFADTKQNLKDMGLYITY